MLEEVWMPFMFCFLSSLLFSYWGRGGRGYVHVLHKCVKASFNRARYKLWEHKEENKQMSYLTTDRPWDQGGWCCCHVCAARPGRSVACRWCSQTPSGHSPRQPGDQTAHHRSACKGAKSMNLAKWGFQNNKLQVGFEYWIWDSVFWTDRSISKCPYK